MNDGAVLASKARSPISTSSLAKLTACAIASASRLLAKSDTGRSMHKATSPRREPPAGRPPDVRPATSTTESSSSGLDHPGDQPQLRHLRRARGRRPSSTATSPSASRSDEGVATTRRHPRTDPAAGRSARTWRWSSRRRGHSTTPGSSHRRSPGRAPWRSWAWGTNEAPRPWAEMIRMRSNGCAGPSAPQLSAGGEDRVGARQHHDTHTRIVLCVVQRGSQATPLPPCPARSSPRACSWSG